MTYGALEQMRGDTTVDGRANLCSLGLVMYEMIVGRKLFAGVSQQEIIGRQLYEPHDHVLTFAPSVSVAFRQLVAKALTKDRSRRFATAWELLDALAGIPTEGTGNKFYMVNVLHQALCKAQRNNLAYTR